MQTGNLSLDQAPPENIPNRFFLTVPIFGFFAGLLIAFKGDGLFLTTWHNDTIALTHLLTLGWMAMTMIGAIYQMIPVLVGARVPMINLAKIVHVFLTIGVLALVEGLLYYSQWLYYTAIVCVSLAFLIFLLQVIPSVFKVKADRPVVLAMRVSVISLLATVILGVMALGGISGWWSYPIERFPMKSMHITYGLLGWIGTLVIGVGFHVIPMFYITTAFPKEKSKLITWGIISTLLLVPQFLWLNLDPLFVIAAGLPALVAIVVFAYIVFDLLKKRRRKIVDTTLHFWKISLFTLPVSIILLVLNTWIGSETLLYIFGIIFLIGFSVAITTGMLYKIVPFLVWFHRFSSLVGKPGVPLLKDILKDKYAKNQMWAFVTMFTLLSIGVVVNIGEVIQLAGIVLCISSIMVFTNIVMALRQDAYEEETLSF